MGTSNKAIDGFGPSTDISKMRIYSIPFFSTLIFGFAAHMFMLTNKIPVDDDLCFLFSKGATTVSGRWGLELLRLVMPDASMPWIYGLLSLLLLAGAVCLSVDLFAIKSWVFQALIGGLFITFPAETGTMCYMFTAAPYAFSMLMSIAAIYVFEKNVKLRWILAPTLLVLSCSIYQGYFAFAASFSVLLLVKELLENKKTVAEVFKHGLVLFAMLLISVLIYGLSVVIAGRIAGVSVLNVVNSRQSVLMRIAVAYSAYLNTIFNGYFAYINTRFSCILHLLLIGLSAILVIYSLCRAKDLRRALLLGLCLFLLPLSCYCLYLLADNGYIHSLTLFPFVSLYILFALVIECLLPEKQRICRFLSIFSMAAIILTNIYFANSFYLYNSLQYESRVSFYTSILTQVKQTEGFNEDSVLALIGEDKTSIYAITSDLNEHFDFEMFTLPGNNITESLHAKDLIRYYLGCNIPIADESQCQEIKASSEFQQMPVYPYYGSVQKIGEYIVVKLGE